MGKNKQDVDNTELAALKEAVLNLTAENTRLQQKLERMNELLLNAQRARFGQSSEKQTYVTKSHWDSDKMNGVKTFKKGVITQWLGRVYSGGSAFICPFDAYY